MNYICFNLCLQLCITINNIEQVRRALKQLPETLNFVNIQHAIEQNEGGELGVKSNLHATVKEADQMMLSKIQRVVDHVADKVAEHITPQGCLLFVWKGGTINDHDLYQWDVIAKI